MERESYETSDSPTIIIENIAGSLRVKGWDEPMVRADADRKNSIMGHIKDDTVTLSCNRDCFIRVPIESKIEINNVAGEVYLKFLGGDLTIVNVADDLYLKNVVATEIQNVSGHFSARQVEGELNVESVQGSVDVRDVSDNINFGIIAGSLKLREIEADLFANVSGDVNLRLDPDPEAVIKVISQGNINCKLSEFASAEIKLKSASESIIVKVPGISERIQSNAYEFTLSHGESKLTLDAQGSISIKTQSDSDEIGASFDFEFNEGISNLADEITDQVSGQIEAQMEMLNEKLSNFTSGMASGAVARAEASARRAERKVAAAQKRLERKMAAARRRGERKTKRPFKRDLKYQAHQDRYHRSFSSSQPSDPVTDEERQLVLQMIQDKKISVEVAEKLLTALEGHSDEPQKGSLEISKIPEIPEIPDIPEIPNLPDIAELEVLADLSEVFSKDTKESDDVKPKKKKTKKSKKK